MNVEDLKTSAAMLGLIGEIDEFKGAWRALGQLAPEQLSSMQRVATIESIGSSTRIEGSRLSDQQVEILFNNLQTATLSSRDEQEVAGYAAVMNIIFDGYAEMPFTESTIRQLHRELLRYSEKDDWHRGSYKTSSNNVEAFGPNGESLGVVFETVSPFETPLRMADLVAWAETTMTSKALHPLLVTGVFVVEFLAIHPFQDGNGRLSRVLTTWLLLRSGYSYAPYSSLEAVIEQNKDAYYRALRQTQITLHTNAVEWQPWLLFFLSAMAEHKRRLERKVEREQMLLTRMPELSQSILVLVKERGRITIGEIVALTGANRNTVKKHLEALTEKNQLQKMGATKGAWYVLRS